MSSKRFLLHSFTFTQPRASLAALASGICAGCLFLSASFASEPLQSNQDRLLQDVPELSLPAQVPSALPIPIAPALPILVAPALSIPGAPALSEQVDSAPQSQPTGFATFHLTTQDRHISQALRRFAGDHGWKLSWEIDRDFAIEYAATFSGPFLDIVEQIARSLQNANTPIRVKAYHGNRVLRVLYATY